jgi:hypothetical protein
VKKKNIGGIHMPMPSQEWTSNDRNNITKLSLYFVVPRLLSLAGLGQGVGCGA